MKHSLTTEYQLSTTVAKERVLKAEGICIQLDMNQAIIDFIYRNNGQANENGYHNFQHLLTVAINTYEGAEAHHIMSRPTKQALFIAGLCHDIKYDIYAHESVNIQNAMDFVMKTLPDQSFVLNRSVYNRAADFIAATYFPHVYALSIEEKIIQDADLLQNLEPDAHLFLQGLENELNHKNLSATVDVNFPNEDMLNTQWAKELIRNR